MHVDAHKEVDNFVLTYLTGEGIDEQYPAAITKKVDNGDGLDAVHYFPREQSSEISRHALTTFYRSKFSDGIEGYNEKRSLTATGYDLLSENIGNENYTERDTLVEEKGLDGAFDALESGHPDRKMTDAEKADKKAAHFH